MSFSLFRLNFLIKYGTEHEIEKKSSLGGSAMKTRRILVLLVLVVGLLAGLGQAPAEAELLGRPSQMISLGYGGESGGNWYQTKPDGTSSLFTLAPGQSFIMTEFRGRFYATDPASDTGPYRLYLLGPNSSIIYVANLPDFTYPHSNIVSGGVLVELNLQPGYVFIAPPTPQVRQLPPPPDNPNSGPVRNGTFFLMMRGYVVP
jgi:hypothetical protein